ncbi:MAG: hypothetical protein OJF50_002914 [Nitrospira sp.]|nr:hypothetical protein [Nitrospira sp.]
MLNESVLLPNTRFQERTSATIDILLPAEDPQKVSKYPTKLRDESSKIS